MNKVSEIIDFLNNNDITDIFVEGFIDENNDHKTFHLMMENIYLKFDNIFLRCGSINQYDKIGLTIVNKITCDFDIDKDDDFGISSLGELYLPNPDGRNKITRFRALINHNHSEEVDIKCLELCFGDINKIFLDPTNIFGIKIYNGEYMDKFISDNDHILSGYGLYTWDR